jgi:hypothetical protein
MTHTAKQMAIVAMAYSMAVPDMRQLRTWEVEQAAKPASPKKIKARNKAKAARKQRVRQQ